MVGAAPAALAGGQTVSRAGGLFRVEGFTSSGKFEDISFEVNGGEVLGLAGLIGAGRTEIVEAIQNAVTAHAQGAPPADDITVVVARRT